MSQSVSASSPASTGLDEAWRKAEAALPEGWQYTSIIRMNWSDTKEWLAGASEMANPKNYIECLGPTPAAALRALAARLSEAQTRQMVDNFLR